MEDRFSKNLAIADRRFPAAARAARSADDSITLVPSKSGAMTGRAGAVWLASRYDPVREAETFAKGQDIKPGASVALYGVGLGYHLRPLLDAAGPGGKVMAAEANGAVLRAALKIIGPGVLEDPRLGIVAAPGKEEFLSLWADAFGALDGRGAKVVVHGPSTRAIPAGFEDVSNAVEMIRIDRRFPFVMGPLERENLGRNLPRLLRSPGVGRLAGLFRGEPVAIVGGGPSLDGQAAFFAFQDRMRIFTSDTALPALLEHGVEPDLVFSVDPQEDSLLHFVLAGRFDLPLVLTPTACAGLVERWEGPLIFGFKSPDRYPAPADRWAERMGSFESGGSVSCVAFETALISRASTVIMLGLDFGAPGGRGYASGTAPDILGAAPWNPKETVMEKNCFGEDVPSSALLNSYRREFERLAAGADARVVNISGRGVRADGVQAAPSPLPYIADAGRKGRADFKKFQPEPAGGDVAQAFEKWLKDS
ncbi:MAG: motility associated factor glycosyltransferase family protein [Candidatus Nitrospinota bacterium M3_3B_026]